jgi:hypothetical protein
MTACAAKFLQQTDFVIRKWPHFLSKDHNRALQGINLS